MWGFFPIFSYKIRQTGQIFFKFGVWGVGVPQLAVDKAHSLVLTTKHDNSRVYEVILETSAQLAAAGRWLALESHKSTEFSLDKRAPFWKEGVSPELGMPVLSSGSFIASDHLKTKNYHS